MTWFKKLTMFALLSLVVSGFALLSGSYTQASADAQSQADACQGLSQLNGSATCQTTGPSAGQSTVNRIVTVVVNILSWLVGIVAVIMIIISGFKYVASSGDSGRTSSAKTTLIYALIGVLIVALAQFLVHFALNQGTSAVNGTCASNTSIPASSKSCTNSL
jgi:hypothetical protein